MKPTQLFLATLFLLVLTCCADADDADFNAANAVMTKFCAGCHQADDANGEFSLDTFSGLMKGGESGNALTPGSAASSRMVQMMRGKIEPRMPPDGESVPSQDEIQIIVDWIDSGANGPAGQSEMRHTLDSPSIDSNVKTSAVTALTFSPDQSLIAVGKFKTIEIRSVQDLRVQSVIGDLPGKTTALKFSSDGERIFVGTGITGLFGEVLEIQLSDGNIIRQLRSIDGHRDLVYCLDVSDDETKLVSAGYDHLAIVWDLGSDNESPKQISRMKGHNGAIFAAEFDSSSEILATASADATVKIWNVADGKRLDTRGEPLKEQNTVTFSPDGKSFVAGGEDNRIRKWKLKLDGDARLNPLVISRFAHESTIETLKYDQSGNWIVSVSRDKTIKIWDAKTLEEVHQFSIQPASVQALAVAKSKIAIGRMDGTVELLDWPQLKRAAKQVADSPDQNGEPKIASVNDAKASSLLESEPNDDIATAGGATAPFTFSGTINADDRRDVDFVKFSAIAGEQWIIETKAARDKSKLDSQIAVFDVTGKPVQRVLVQAVRDSYFTFRGKNSTQTDDFRIQNWEEMQIGQLLYCNGEVVRLFHYPRGPDSGYNVFPNFGTRHTMFDTSRLTHALNEPCYIVEAFPPDAILAKTGLPQFSIPFENDDDSEGELGKDSRLTFTAPADGEYFVRIKDARDFQGTDFKYELTVRRPNPSFKIRSLFRDSPKFVKGTWQQVGVEIDRIDGFDGAVEVSIKELPKGFSVAGPTTVEAGQLKAWFPIFASDEAEVPVDGEPLPKFVATATIHGNPIRDTKAISKIEIIAEQKLIVHLDGNIDLQKRDSERKDSQEKDATTGDFEIPVIEVRPGETTSTMLRVDRIKHDKRINFGKENAGLNFPFGVYVDNIGLNGVLIPPDATDREIFITAETFVQPGERLVFLEAEEAGKPASNPVVLRVLEK